MSFRSIILLAVLFFAVACQQAPTKMYEAQPVQAKDSGPQITSQTVILDARPAFEYSLSHLSGAVHMRWEDFTQKKSPYEGLLEEDVFFHARRLARYGIGPDTPVVIVGRGLQGQGEEGRLAWTLAFLGVKKVQFYPMSVFRMPLTQATPPPKAEVSIWKPEVVESLAITDQQMSAALKTLGKGPLQAIAIDVREEYQAPFPSKARTASLQGARLPPNRGRGKNDIGKLWGAHPIPWKEFFTEDGKPRAEIKEKLTALGITPEKKVIALSDEGATSAAVVLALRELGYERATHFPGGFKVLRSK